MALPRRAALVAIATAVSGCAGSPLGTDSPTPTDPGYISCDPSDVSQNIPKDVAAIPDQLSEESVAAYAEELERAIVLPPEDEISDGYVSIGTVEAEQGERGYTATVPVTGGYYNSTPESDSESTIHADLGRYTASYFVTGQVVRRVKNATAELDARNHGEVVVCESG
jgi:hypothetical protein